MWLCNPPSRELPSLALSFSLELNLRILFLPYFSSYDVVSAASLRRSNHRNGLQYCPLRFLSMGVCKMAIYSPERKAIYLSPNRLDLLHRRRGLSDQQNVRIVCAG